MAVTVDERLEADFDIRRSIEAGEFGRVERCLSDVLQRGEQPDAELYAAMAEIRNQQEEFDAAQKFAEQSIERDAGLVEGVFQKACALFAKQEIDTARVLLDQVAGPLEGDARYQAQMARVCLRRGEARKAHAFADRAISLRPEESRYYALKAELLLGENKLSEAATFARRAVRLDESDLRAWSLVIRATLGLSKKGDLDKEIKKIRKRIPQPERLDCEIADYLAARGRHVDAEQRLLEILAAHPENGQAYQVLTMVYINTRQWGKAIETGYKALGFSPYSLSAWKNIGIELAENGEYYAAMGWLHRALLADPEDILVGTLYAYSLHQMREYAAAQDLYLQILEEQPDSPTLLHLYALLLMDMGRNKEALSVIQRASDLARNDYSIQMNLAMAYTNAGDFEEARGIYRRIMADMPETSEAFLYYTDITPMAEDQEWEGVLSGYERSARDPKQKEEYNFALAKLYEDKREFEKSFQHLSRACSLHKQRLGYNEEAHLQGMRLIKGIFNPEYLGRFEGCGSDSSNPIFVLGMPRSGTTLVEQILASHPDVVGGGELTVMDSIVRNHAAKVEKPMVHSLADLDCDEISRMANEYLTMTASIGAGGRRLVNKFPHNFLHIGLLSLMFPNARIILLKRDPMAICFSCYKKRFVNGHEYAFDLQDLGNYYLGFQDLMNHWHRVLPDRVYKVEYEKLTGDFENEARKLIAHCGLEWDDACLQFHKSRRAVRTASQSQVRKPIYKKAVSFWRNFEQQLKPLSDILQGSQKDGEEAS